MWRLDATEDNNKALARICEETKFGFYGFTGEGFNVRAIRYGTRLSTDNVVYCDKDMGTLYTLAQGFVDRVASCIIDPFRYTIHINEAEGHPREVWVFVKATSLAGLTCDTGDTRNT
jgi:hypothetical protein